MTAQEQDWIIKGLGHAVTQRKWAVGGAAFIWLLAISLLCIAQPAIARQLQKPDMVAFVCTDLLIMSICPVMFILLIVRGNREVKGLKTSLASNSVEVFEGEDVITRIPSSGLLLDGYYPGAKPKFARLD